MLVNGLKLKFSCQKNGQEVAIVNKVPRVVSDLTFVPVFDPLLDQGKFLELLGKSRLHLVTPELSAGDEIDIGRDFIVTITQPSTSPGSEKLPVGKKK